MAEEIVVKCSTCGKKLKTDTKYVGHRARCPGCGSIIRISKQQDGATEAVVEQVVHLDELPTRKDAMLKVVKQNDIGIVSFRTSRILDQSNVQQLGEEFDELIDKFKLTKIVINFHNIHYMSSAVMGKLVSLHKKLKGAGGKLRLCNILPNIYEIFEIMRFNKLFDICATEDEAVIELMK
jgi:anti-sigma B factor antagonist